MINPTREAKTINFPEADSCLKKSARGEIRFNLVL